MNETTILGVAPCKKHQMHGCMSCTLEEAARAAAFGPTLTVRDDARAHGADTAETKDTNPKDAIGCTKLPLSLVPATAIGLCSLALLNGKLKYGQANWRIAGVRASIYLDALRRHISAWENGEECDPDDGVPHLAAALACLSILVDARACGKLTDDRPPSVPLPEFFRALTPHVERLKTLHKDRNPRHWTIADTEMP